MFVDSEPGLGVLFSRVGSSKNAFQKNSKNTVLDNSSLKKETLIENIEVEKHQQEVIDKKSELNPKEKLDPNSLLEKAESDRIESDAEEDDVGTELYLKWIL